ncbi:MAG: hypothetical protein U1E46_05870 [Hyphomicrobiales bacterium]
MPLTQSQVNSTQEAKILGALVAKLVSQDMASANALLKPGIPGAETFLNDLASLLSSKPPMSSQFMDRWTAYNNGTSSSGIGAQIETQDEWILLSATFGEASETLPIIGLTIQTAVKQPGASSPFATSPPYVRILTLLSETISTFAIIGAFILCIRDRNLNRKLLWLLAILLITPGIYIDNDSGTIMLTFFNIGWMGLRTGFHTSVPIGSIAYFVHRSRRVTAQPS